MAEWHPVQEAFPTEWVMDRPRRSSTNLSPYAIIRRIEKGDPVEHWFRVVTWDADPENRELIGWCRTLEAAAQAAWDYNLAADSWRRHHTSSMSWADQQKSRPPAADLLRAYREVEAERGPRR